MLSFIFLFAGIKFLKTFIFPPLKPGIEVCVAYANCEWCSFSFSFFGGGCYT